MQSASATRKERHNGDPRASTDKQLALSGPQTSAKSEPLESRGAIDGASYAGLGHFEPLTVPDNLLHPVPETLLPPSPGEAFFSFEIPLRISWSWTPHSVGS